LRVSVSALRSNAARIANARSTAATPVPFMGAHFDWIVAANQEGPPVENSFDFRHLSALHSAQQNCILFMTTLHDAARGTIDGEDAHKARAPVDLAQLPLAGVRVIEFGHTILGPCCGMVLADLGADVLKIEPPGGEPTRRLKGFGAGYFAYFNRNKRSVSLDYKTPDGLREVKSRVLEADVLIENMAPGALQRAGLGEAELRALHPRLIYCSLKGFLPGPYGRRVALDEVVQMMSGLAYMTGPPGKPLRAGTSITDILAGVFGAVGILASLRERDRIGAGGSVECGLFETAAFLMGQHMAYSATTGVPIPPMPARVSAWAVYEIFEAGDGEPLFIGITSDAQWLRFCEVFGAPALAIEPRYASNSSRIDARESLIASLKQIFATLSADEITRRCEVAGIPFAPVAKPESLFCDPHLLATGSLAETRMPDGSTAQLPKLPIRLNHASLGLRTSPPLAPKDPESAR
jgi:crotonobetainyl-CoA:carnitine CoA-transferase CaiB-like acyl-CoA transferase